MNTKVKGFSLVEMAIVLVIFGLVLASASSILTLFVNRGGSEKTRQMIASDKNALVSYVQTKKQLPADAEFATSVSYPLDGYNVNYKYYPDAKLIRDTWGLGDIAFNYVNTVCGLDSTDTEVWVCNKAACPDDADWNQIENIAYVIASGGENKIIQTANETNVIKVYMQGTNGIANINDADVKMKYDDIVDWMSLDELRSKVGCTGERIKFTNQTLPYVKPGTDYSVKLYIEGGIPFVGAGNTAEYEFQIENADDNLLISTNNLGFFFSDDPADDLPVPSTFEQGKFVKISGNASTLSGAGQPYKVTINVKDQTSNVYTRTFMLNVAE